MQDTINFLPLEDCDNPKSAHFIDPNEIPFRIRERRPAKIHRQMTKGEVFIQKGKDKMNKLYPVSLPNCKKCNDLKAVPSHGTFIPCDCNN